MSFCWKFFPRNGIRLLSHSIDSSLSPSFLFCPFLPSFSFSAEATSALDTNTEKEIQVSFNFWLVRVCTNVWVDSFLSVYRCFCVRLLLERGADCLLPAGAVAVKGGTFCFSLCAP